MSSFFVFCPIFSVSLDCPSILLFSLKFIYSLTKKKPVPKKKRFSSVCVSSRALS
jgi:hypothetical protein